jgi:hypothetical protein
MSLFNKIRQPFAKKRLRREQLEALSATLWRVVADGQITDAELAEIDRFFYDSELSVEEIQKAEADVFSQLVYQAISDRRVTDAEFQSLDHIAVRLALAPQVRNQLRQQIEYYQMLHRLESGGELPTAEARNIILQKNEICHLSLPAVLYEERFVRSTYQGGSRGVSFRIMKGVSYRVGAHRGDIQAERALVPVSDGTFSVTNKRLIFSGNKKSNSTPIPKLLDLQLYADAIQYSITTRQKPVIVGFSDQSAELCAVVISRLINTYTG